MQTDDYAVAQGINHEPGFNWCVDAVLRKREIIISMVRKPNDRYLKKTHKFGVDFPNLVTEAYALDKNNSNTVWADSMAKEMKDVNPVFRIMEDSEKVPIGFQRVIFYIIFDVKMEDLSFKFRLVSCGHTTNPLLIITYASFVSCETVIIPLTLAALNDLEVKVADIHNAYITAPVTEKI